MTRTGELWSDLHDAVLESIELAWSSGEARILLTTADPSLRAIVAASVCRFDDPRHQPWGSSAAGPSSTSGATVVHVAPDRAPRTKRLAEAQATLHQQ